jgi:hypothetical protein
MKDNGDKTEDNIGDNKIDNKIDNKTEINDVKNNNLCVDESTSVYDSNDENINSNSNLKNEFIELQQIYLNISKKLIKNKISEKKYVEKLKKLHGNGLDYRKITGITSILLLLKKSTMISAYKMTLILFTYSNLKNKILEKYDTYIESKNSAFAKIILNADKNTPISVLSAVTRMNKIIKLYDPKFSFKLIAIKMEKSESKYDKNYVMSILKDYNRVEIIERIGQMSKLFGLNFLNKHLNIDIYSRSYIDELKYDELIGYYNLINKKITDEIEYFKSMCEIYEKIDDVINLSDEVLFLNINTYEEMFIMESKTKEIIEEITSAKIKIENVNCKKIYTFEDSETEL